MKHNLKMMLTGIEARSKLPPSTKRCADQFPDGIPDVLDSCTVNLIEGGAESNVVFDKMVEYVPSVFDRSSFTTNRPPDGNGTDVSQAGK